MDRLEKISQVTQTLSLATSAVVGQQVSSWMERQKAFPAWLPPLAALLIVVVGLHVLQALLETLFSSLKPLRRLLLGNQFIEGIWFDLSQADGRPIVVGIARIMLAGSTVRFYGDDFSVDGTRQGHYMSDYASLEWPKLKYKYTYHVSGTRQLSNQGFGEAQFLARGGPPQQYVGFHFDILEGQRVTYEGWRIEDRSILDKLDNPNTRRKVVLEFFRVRLEEAKGVQGAHNQGGPADG